MFRDLVRLVLSVFLKVRSHRGDLLGVMIENKALRLAIEKFDPPANVVEK